MSTSSETVVSNPHVTNYVASSAPVVAVEPESAPVVAVPVLLPESLEVKLPTPALMDIPVKMFLQPLYFMLPCGSVFVDKKIPTDFDNSPPHFKESPEYPKSYFVELHKNV